MKNAFDRTEAWIVFSVMMIAAFSTMGLDPGAANRNAIVRGLAGGASYLVGYGIVRVRRRLRRRV
jgi:hypothetical protein